MRLRPTLDVSDTARRMIARMHPDAARTARGHMATRAAVISYIQSRLDAISGLAPWWDDEPLRPDEAADAAAAIQYLRHANKTDAEIRAWLLLQRARYDIHKARSDLHTRGNGK